jgi:hypothetical protein
VTAIRPPSSANALVPIDSRHQAPAVKKPEAATPVLQGGRHGGGLPAAPLAVRVETRRPVGPGRDLAAYHQADALGTAMAGSGHIVDILV